MPTRPPLEIDQTYPDPQGHCVFHIVFGVATPPRWRSGFAKTLGFRANPERQRGGGDYPHHAL